MCLLQEIRVQGRSRYGSGEAWGRGDTKARPVRKGTGRARNSGKKESFREATRREGLCLDFVELVPGDDGKIVFLQKFNGLIGAVKAEDDNGRAFALVYEGIHVFHIDAAGAQHF